MEHYLKTARWEDLDLLFAWANDPAVRRNSFSSKEILYEEHKTWYRKLLSDPDRRQYLYVQDGIPVGQVRVAAAGDDAEVSYSICAEKRGKGHGKRLLCLLQKQIKEDFPQVKHLIAKVKAGNAASGNAFLGAGYQKDYEVYRIECYNSGRQHFV